MKKPANHVVTVAAPAAPAPAKDEDAAFEEAVSPSPTPEVKPAEASLEFPGVMNQVKEKISKEEMAVSMTVTADAEATKPVNTTKEKKTMTKRTRKSPTKKTTTPKEKDYTEFYKKYAHVVKGSVRDPNAADTKAVSESHGKVCTIKCIECKTERTINCQDAFQVKHCLECKDKLVKARRAQRRAKRAKRSKS
jgi:ribosomal protein S27E